MPSSKFGSKFLGKERYQQYVEELTAEGTIDGEQLSPEERKEGFKKRNDKIGFEDFVDKVLDKKQSATISKGPKSLPGKGRGGALVKRQPGALVKSDSVSKAVPQEGSNILEEILKIVTSIRDTLIKQNEFDKKQDNQQRQSAERRQRKSREEKLEGNVFKGLAKAANKVLGPVKSLFDKVFDFIKTILIGRFLVKLIDWIGNKDNQEKLTAIGKFLSKTWPAILAAYLLFGNSLGRFITKMILMTLKFIPKIAMTIAKLAAAHPLAAAAIAGAGLFVAGAVIPKLMPGTVDEQERKTAAAPGTTAEKIRALEEQKANLNFLQRMQGVGAEIDEQIKFLETGQTAAYSGGGLVQGFSGGGLARGTDTVPAMLTPGEFIMSRGAVNRYGVDTLASMNAAGGGTNRPRMIGGSVYASGGGQIHESGRKLQGDSETKNADIDPESGLPMNKPAAVPNVTPTQPIIPSSNKSSTAKNPIVASMGFSQEDFDVFRNVVASIESGGKYDIAGGSGGHYDGRYQLGAAAKTDGARYAGVEDPGHTPEAREAFRKNPQLQEALFAGFTKANHTYLMGNTEYKNANPRRKLQILGYAHNQGMGGAEKWMTTGVVGSDGFGTKGTKYTDAIAAAFKTGKVPSVSAPSSSGPMIASDSSSSSSSNVSGGGGTASFDKSLLGTFDYNKVRQQLGAKTSSVSKPSRPSSSTAAYNQMQQQTQQQGQQQTEQPQTSDIPAFDAAAMSSPKKIKTLGITV